MIEGLQLLGLALSIVAPLGSAAYVVGTVRAELVSVRRDVDRHDNELRELRRVGAL